MKLKMARNSLFAILLRSPWWISIGIAAGIVLLARASLREHYAVYGALAGAPFLVVGLIAAWKRFRAPSPKQVAATMQAIRSMSWPDFSSTIENAFCRNGYLVAKLDGPGADFAISKQGSMMLVSCKRWKASNNGIDAFHGLHNVMQARGAREAIYLAAGEISDNARRFAAEKKIRVVQGAELAQLVRRAGTGERSRALRGS
jgi:restriction system protein